MDSLMTAMASGALVTSPIDNRVVSAQLQNDLFEFIAQSYSSFEAGLFRADTGSYKEATETESAADRVGRIEQKESKINYQSIETVRAVEYPKDMQGRSLTDSGLTSDGELYEDTLLMLFSVPDVPEQSLVIYNEMIADETAKLTALYVLDGKPIGKHALAGKVYRCIPLRGDVVDILAEAEQQQANADDSEVHQQSAGAGFSETGLHDFFES